MQFVGNSYLDSTFQDFGDASGGGDDDDVAIVIPDEDSDDPEMWDSDDQQNLPEVVDYRAKFDEPYGLGTPGSSASDDEVYGEAYGDDGGLEPEIARLHLRDSSPDDLGFVDYNEEDLNPKPVKKISTKTKKREKTSHKENCTSCKTKAERPNVLLTPRDFHKNRNYVTARYNTRPKTENSHTMRKLMNIPKSLCPSLRYGKEARVQSCRSSSSTHRPWKKPAEHPPIIKHKDQASECAILRVIHTTDAAAQAEPHTTETSVQCVPPTCHTATQYTKLRRHHVSVQAPGVQHQHVGVQSAPPTANVCTETDVSLMYYPPVAYGTQDYHIEHVQHHDHGLSTVTVAVREDSHTTKI